MLKKISLLDLTIVCLFLLFILLGWQQYKARQHFSLPRLSRQDITQVEIAYPHHIIVQLVQKNSKWLMASPIATASIDHSSLDSLLDIGEKLPQADLVSQNAEHFAKYQRLPAIKVTYSTAKQKETVLFGKTSPNRGGTFLQYHNKIWLVPVFFSPPASASGWLQK